ncbi:MAG: hypothetical protein ACT4O9_04825 [Blastocatellia bacterium]
MYKAAILIAVAMIHFAFSQSAFSQITINLPKMPKIGKPKIDSGKTGNGVVQDQHTTTTDSTQGQQKNRDGKNIYPFQRPTGTPVLLKNTIYVQAITHNEYWKMKGQSNYSSWVPKLRFSHFYNNDKKLNHTVEYFNPDGSAWYSEKLEQGFFAADRTVGFQSPSPWGGVLDTKSTAATGIFSFKITNDDTREVLYQGKFKVGKFGTSHNPQEKYKVDFFVDHDWLMPFGMIGFHHSLDEVGGMPLLVSVWLKGDVSASELEGRIFYKGQQIASTKDGGGAGDYDERMSDKAPAFSPLNRWKRWEFQWRNFLFDNNGTFNRENFPNAFYADKNPGEYTVKIYRNGTQIRELGFTIGADGRYVAPSYTGQIYMPYHRILLPVKVMGTEEKWNANAWKTEAFYGNPLTGFTVQ